jgi:DNA-binding transcriptional LysR family regulator
MRNIECQLCGSRIAATGCPSKGSYASPSYIHSHWFEGDKTNAIWLGRGQSEQSNRWVRNSPFPQATIRHELSDPRDQAQAVVAGLGMAVLPCFYADRVAGLVRFPGTGAVSTRSGWVLTHPDLRTSDEFVRVFAF